MKALAFYEMKIGRYFKITGLVLAGVVILVLTLTVVMIGYDVLFSGRSAAQFANTQYPGSDNTTLNAYVAAPSEQARHPAILLIHEWWGLNEDIVAKADALASEGYVVMAVDAWRGVSTRSVPRAVLQIASTSQERVSGDLDAAFRYLAGLETVDRERIAVMGFCYGGGQSLRFGMKHPDVAATILFYGQLITDPADLAPLRDGGPVLGIFGEEDFGIPPDQVREFERALNELKVRSQITIYPGVGHAFANQADAIQNPGPAKDAWNQTLGFLNAHLKQRSLL